MARRTENFLSYNDLKKEVQSKGITSRMGYLEEQKNIQIGIQILG